MSNVIRSHFWIAFSLMLALVLQVVPWPGELSHFRPSWVVLVTLYWALALPHRVNIGIALIVGLMWDLILGSTLGVRGLVMAILCYLVALNFQLLRNLSLWQQALVMAALTLTGILMEFWVEYLVAPIHFDVSRLFAVVVNAFIWPWIFLLLRRMRRKFAIR